MKRIISYIIIQLLLSCKPDATSQKLVEQSVQNWIKKQYSSSYIYQSASFYEYYEVSNIDSIITQTNILESEIHLYKLQKKQLPADLKEKLKSLRKSQEEEERIILGYNIGHRFFIIDSLGNKVEARKVFNLNRDYLVKEIKDDFQEGEDLILPKGIDADSLKKIQRKLIKEGYY